MTIAAIQYLPSPTTADTATNCVTYTIMTNKFTAKSVIINPDLSYIAHIPAHCVHVLRLRRGIWCRVLNMKHTI